SVGAKSRFRTGSSQFATTRDSAALGRFRARELLVNRPFKRAVSVQDCRIRERDHLRHHEPADFHRRVDPEIGVREAAPAQAAWAPPFGRALKIDEEAQAPALALSGEEITSCDRLGIATLI